MMSGNLPDVPAISLTKFKSLKTEEIRDLPSCIITADGEEFGYFMCAPQGAKINGFFRELAIAAILVKRYNVEAERREKERIEQRYIEDCKLWAEAADKVRAEQLDEGLEEFVDKVEAIPS